MLYNIHCMNITLINEIEDSLEAFARNANPLFDLSDKMADEDSVLNFKDLEALNVCVNFTVGSLAGYLQECEGVL